jgi:23S rRNA (cytosine1962-C5)-methyltransferase
MSSPQDKNTSEERSWKGYELLASGYGQRLERWNGATILRPESEAKWPWQNAGILPPHGGCYSGDHATGGTWSWKTPLPDPCIVNRGSLSFLIKPTKSKHLGLFPEQATNWDWITDLISGSEHRNNIPKVLNLFGYTGGATLAAGAAGASVTHVDSARAMVFWCSENARISGLGGQPIHYIVEDALTFLQREIRRGNRYDGIIMDPPTFGRGKKGELWKLSEHLPYLLDAAQEVLSDQPLFLLLNTYGSAIDSFAGGTPEAVISKRLERIGGSCDAINLGLEGTLDGKRIPCGTSYRWSV